MATKSQANAAPTEADADTQPDASAAAQADPQPKTPPTPDAAPPTAPAVAGHRPGGVFEYVDATPSKTLFDGFAPQSAQYGDVCLLPYDPQLPRWQRSSRAVNRQPDTDPDEVEAASAAQSAARAEVHAAVLEQQLAAAAAHLDTTTGV